jgi:hypothetical protein
MHAEEWHSLLYSADKRLPDWVEPMTVVGEDKYECLLEIPSILCEEAGEIVVSQRDLTEPIVP